MDNCALNAITFAVESDITAKVETWSSEARIHAAACILQVFKLKGNIVLDD